MQVGVEDVPGLTEADQPGLAHRPLQVVGDNREAALDLARMVGVHGGMIDATTPKASLNYETTTGRNGEFVDLDLALYMTPITARLSLDDVMPRGRRVALDTIDFSSLTVDPTGPTTED